MGLPVLVGRIAVGVIWVDSTVAALAITNAEKSKTLSETTEGLNLLATFEPRANIQWFYDFKRPRLSLTAAQAGNEDLWRKRRWPPWPIKLAYELRQRGVDDRIIEEVLSETRDSELERARAVWQKKFGTPPADAAEKARQVRFMQGRGFALELIRRVIEQTDNH